MANQVIHSLISSLNSKLTYSRAPYGTENSDYMCVHKYGRVCYIVCAVNSWYCSAGGAIRMGSETAPEWIIPAGFRPIGICDLKEALNDKRITITSNGNVTCNEALSGINLRFSACYICAE